jgi:hypothetical protein
VILPTIITDDPQDVMFNAYLPPLPPAQGYPGFMFPVPALAPSDRVTMHARSAPPPNILNMLRLLWLFFPGLFVALGGPAIVNHLFAQIQGGFYSLIPGNTRVYCYASITTLDDADTVFAPGCLSVDWKGNFGSVFSAEGMSFGEMRAKGWHIDLTGHVLPGLWDGHAHLLQYGEMLGGVQVYNTHSLNGMLPPSHSSARKLT